MSMSRSEPPLPRSWQRRQWLLFALLLVPIFLGLIVTSVVFYSGVLLALSVNSYLLLGIGGPAGLVCLVLAVTIIWVWCRSTADPIGKSRLSKGVVVARFCRILMYSFLALDIVASVTLALLMGDYSTLSLGFAGAACFFAVGYLAGTISGNLTKLAVAE